MSYGSQLKREIGLHLPKLKNLAEAALHEAAVHGARGVTVPPPRALDDKTFAGMEAERQATGAIVSLRLDGAGWSAHILDPELEGMSAGGFQDPESAWHAVMAQRAKKQAIAEAARRRNWGATRP